jgi:hypothetical protein
MRSHFQLENLSIQIKKREREEETERGISSFMLSATGSWGTKFEIPKFETYRVRNLQSSKITQFEFSWGHKIEK